jgi:hypothetical protein
MYFTLSNIMPDDSLDEYQFYSTVNINPSLNMNMSGRNMNISDRSMNIC